MPAKRTYTIKHSNDFLVLAGIFFFLGIWAVKDAWYPSEKTLKKHPQEFAVAFEAGGLVEKIHVEEGEAIGEKQLLVNLRKDRLAVQFEDAKQVYSETKKACYLQEAQAKKAEQDGAPEASVEALKKNAAVARQEMNQALQTVTELRSTLDAMDVLSPEKGMVKKILISPHSIVVAGDTAVIVDPKDHFYLFNKSLAIFSGFVVILFLGIHFLAR